MKWLVVYYYQMDHRGMQPMKIGGVSDRRKDGINLAEQYKGAKLSEAAGECEN